MQGRVAARAQKDADRELAVGGRFAISRRVLEASVRYALPIGPPLPDLAGQGLPGLPN